MKKLKSTTKRSGFSLMEALIVVGIIAIMLCIAVPDIIAYSRELTLTALDDSAHSIFMAAQNSLSAMKNSGVSEQELIDLGSEAKRFNGETTIDVIMVSAESGEHDDNDNLHKLLPHGSIDSELHKHQYVVDILPKSGTVYAVWYWENGKEIQHVYGVTGYDAENVDYSDKKTRLKNNIMAGFYGGMDISRPDIAQAPIPYVEVINAEELRLNISVSAEGLVDITPVATVTLIGKDGARVEIVSNATLRRAPHTTTEELIPQILNYYMGTITLDTLDDKKEHFTGSEPNFNLYDGEMANSFEKWVTKDDGTYYITPGDNFDIEVRIDIDTGSDKTYDAQYVCKHNVNSLFADKLDNTAYIAYGRHLQNLDNDKSGVTAAKQCGDIDFAAKSTINKYYSWNETYPDRTFNPVRNEKLEEYSGGRFMISHMYIESEGEAGMFDSKCDKLNSLKDIYIKNATIVGKGNVGALMGTVTHEINVIGCRVWIDTPEEFSIDNFTFEGATVGGLVGEAEKSLYIENSFASANIKGDTVGGLAGRLQEEGKIDSCYAAGYLASTNLAGGLIGANASATIADSYSAGVIADARIAGGLIAQGSATASHSYSAVRFSSNVVTKSQGTSVSVYGTFPEDKSTEYISQMGLNFKSDSGVPVTSFDLYVSGWMSIKQDLSEEAQLKEKANVIPYKSIPETKHAYGMSDYYPYKKIITTDGYMPHYGDWLEESEAYLVYYEQYADKTYGLYANHQRLKVNTLKCANYDEDFDKRNYVLDDGYALFIMSAPETAAPLDVDVTINDIHKDLGKKEFVTPFRGMNALCLMYFIQEPTISIPADWGKPDFSWDTYMEGKYKDTNHILNEPVTNYYLKLTYSIQYDKDAGYGQTYTNPYSVKSYYFNPHFACEVFEEESFDTTQPFTNYRAKPGAEGVDEEHRTGGLEILGRSSAPVKAAKLPPTDAKNWAGTVVIRTARHLSNIHCYTNGENRKGIANVKQAHFRQLLDIDFKQYSDNDIKKNENDIEKDNYLLAGGGMIDDRLMPALNYKGSYNGYECLIRNMYLSRDAIADDKGITSVGLFGKVVSSTLSNIRIVNATAFRGERDFADYMGGLVGFAASSTIENCGIFDENKDDVNYAESIPSLRPIYRHRAINSNDSDIILGGLIGIANNSNIKRSFAAVKVFGHTVGGFIGEVGSGTTITDCYSGGYTQHLYDYADGKDDGVLKGYPVYSEQSGTDSTNVGGGGGYAGGFAGIVDAGAKFEGICYSTCSVRNNANINHAGLFAGVSYADLSSSTAILYSTGVMIQTASRAVKSVLLPGFDRFDLTIYGEATNYNSEEYLRDLKSLSSTNKVTFVYTYNSDLGTTYPYPSNLTEHYGDWV